METKINIESKICLDHLPTEIIFIIFDYLSSNDIIYTFFFLTQRFNNLLLQNQHYFNYLELPTTNLRIWKNILSIIGSRINSLNITTIDLSFSLIYFSNLKSIIISSLCGLPDEELKSIVKSNQFQNLHSFQIKENFNRYYNHSLTIRYNIFKKVFNHQNSLKIFQCSMIISKFPLNDINHFKINYNLHSLTLTLIDFRQIFSLIEFTPNLKYLNIQSQRSYTHQIPLNKIGIKLEQLYLTLERRFDGQIDFDQLINFIKQFSSSLTCLSLNLVGMHIENINEIPFNGTKLQQLLESMKELKQLHLYAQLRSVDSPFNYDIILSQFQNQYWFDHNWSFGMYGPYFFTLPFHFDYLYGLYGDFDNVKSNNPEILINNPRIWYNVKFVECLVLYSCDEYFVKKLKMKIPKLTSIEFTDFGFSPIREAGDLRIIKDEREKIDLRLDNVTTVAFFEGYIEDQKDWIIYSLPNLRHLILCSTKLPSIDSEIVPILNKRIQQLDIHGEFNKQLIETSYVYFSNVQQINICLNDQLQGLQLYADVIKILTNFKNLKTLFIHMNRVSGLHLSANTELSKAIQYLEMNGITKNYQVKHIQEYCLFLKRELNDTGAEDDVSLTSKKSSFFSNLNCFISRKKRS